MFEKMKKVCFALYLVDVHVEAEVLGLSNKSQKPLRCNGFGFLKIEYAPKTMPLGMDCAGQPRTTNPALRRVSGTVIRRSLPLSDEGAMWRWLRRLPVTD
jgi:hypothetical protein